MKLFVIDDDLFRMVERKGRESNNFLRNTLFHCQISRVRNKMSYIYKNI